MPIVLIVSATQSSKENISSLLMPRAFTQICYASSYDEAKHTLHQQRDISVIIINAPLKDGKEHSLAKEIIESTSASVILLLKKETADSILEYYEDLGVMILTKPFRRIDFIQMMTLSYIFEKRCRIIKKENVKLRQQLCETRIIYQAKCVLMQCFQMSEDSAHHYIEKQSMNLRQSKFEVSMDILHKHENTKAAY